MLPEHSEKLWEEDDSDRATQRERENEEEQR